MSTAVLYVYLVSLIPSVQDHFTIFTKKSHFTPFIMMILHLSSSVIEKVLVSVPLPLGRLNTAVPGVISSAQNGSVPFALYDDPTGVFGWRPISVDTPRGMLGYGLEFVVGLVPHQVHAERPDIMIAMMMIFRIERK
jgi:hypothetical protein